MDMAIKYVKLVDQNKNGMIEKDEYVEFFANFDGISLNEDEIDAMFSEADVNKSNALTTKEFADSLF